MTGITENAKSIHDTQP